MLRIFVSVILIFAIKNVAMAQGTQEYKLFTTQVSEEVDLGYLLYLPEGFDISGNTGYPLILFLHGSGERGNDPELIKKNGPPAVAEEMNLPFIILSPQCPDIPKWNVEHVKLLLDRIIETYPVDISRIYITGLSMGGFGTWEMMLFYPDIFAAAVPVCGGGWPFRAKTISHIPIWVFHGAEDDVVDIMYSELMVNALRELDAEVKFTVYPEANHNAWDETYSNPEVYNWMLQHELRK